MKIDVQELKSRNKLVEVISVQLKQQRASTTTIFKMKEESLAITFSLKLIKLAGQNIEVDSFLTNVVALIAIALQIFLLSLGPLQILWGDLLDINDIQQFLTATINYGIFIVELLIYRIKINQVRRIVHSVKDFWPVDKLGSDLAKKQRRLYKMVYNIIRIYFTFGFFIAIFLTIAPLFKEERELIYIKSEILLESPYYEIIYIIQCLDPVFIIVFLVGFTGILYYCLIFCYCQMNMLKTALANLDFTNADKEEDEKKVFKLLQEYMEHNIKILKFFEDINEVYSYAMLTEFYTSILNNCIPLFLIARFGTEDVGDFFKSFLTIVTNMIQILLTSIAVTLYSNEVESLSNAIYASNWADVAISKRLKAGIILLMQKSQEGQNFIAGKIYVVNMPNFVSIVQLAFSFYTLMRSFNK